jgi:protein involved in polysaccharide export with SLBB domain
VLKPGDTVLVDISLPSSAQSEAPAAPQSTAAPAAAQTTNLSGLPLSPTQLAQLQQLTGQTPSSMQNKVEGPQLPPEELAIGERERLESLALLIRAHNPYQLDSMGQLLLPGIPPIALAGLSEDLATRRLRAEPAFERFQARITRLPLDKSGVEALKPFGYDLFDNSLVSFLPSLNTPVPSEYIVGPGDKLQVQLYGTQNRLLTLLVNREGRVDFPEIGPIDVASQRYGEAKSNIEAQVARHLTGVRANVSMVETRTMNVFVLGAAKYPGSYTITGLATVTTALFAAGGVQTTGSLRSIKVTRRGQVVRNIDLYDLLMRGDSSSDIKLEAGDVVFIPQVGNTAALDGEVLRPAIYELKGSESVADLIRMGGGLTPNGDRDSAALIRVDERQRRTVLDVNPSAQSAAELTLRNGDELRVPRLLPELVSSVSVQGYVYRPRDLAWHPGLRLSQVLPSTDELKPNADQHYVLIRRELPPNRRVVVFSSDLTGALAAPGSDHDTLLMPRDRVRVFDLQNSRQYVIEPLMEELRLQANLAQPTEIVHVEGRVKVPGDYPLEPGMRVSDLIRAGGSLDSSAYTGRAELSRYSIVNGDQRRTQVLTIDLDAIRRGDPQADLVLQPFDRLSVKEVSGWTEQAQVTLSGEVRFPGVYAIKRGETLRSVMERAGGLTDLAFPEGAVFTRQELKREEQEQLDRLAQHMRMDIAEMALMGTRAGIGGSEAAVSIGQTILSQLQAAKAVGRLVINLEGVMHARPGSSNDLILRDGDALVVPKQRQDVMVLGEVQDSTSHLYHPGLTRDDYIEQSGGITRQADAGQIYVVHADGSIVTGKHGWFTAAGSVRIRPGDAIVVPLDTVKLPALTVWQQSTSILYNLAIAVAAVHAL